MFNPEQLPDNSSSEPVSVETIGNLQKKYNLHNEDIVEFEAERKRKQGEKIPNNPEKTVGRYLDDLSSKHSLFNADVPEAKLRQQRQIEQYIVKPEDIPESYFENQKRLAYERGYGHVEITPETKDELTETLRADQMRSLERWVDYLSDKDAPYPTWFKYYTYRSVTGLSGFDKEKQEFRKRSKGTTAPFPDLNREALAYVFDNLDAYTNGQRVDDEDIEKLLEGANFGKLYAHAIERVTPASPEERESVSGEWVKYDQTDDPQVGVKLATSLQGYGTGWCTAGENTAQMQLEAGDFYVWYSENSDGKSTVPRIAVRMEGGKVAEVRGINSNQNLEEKLIDVAADKLQELPGGAEYQKKVDDMKRMTEIDNRLQEGGELTAEDIFFLRFSDIQGFGYDDDPRIINALKNRSEEEDMQLMLDTYDHAELAPQLIKSGHADIVVRYLEEFESGAVDHAELVASLADSRSGLTTIVNNLDKFEPDSIDHSELVDIVARTKPVLAPSYRRDWSNLLVVVQNLEKFNIDHAEFVSRLISQGEGNIVIKYLEKFDSGAVDRSALAKQLISEGKEYLVVDNLDKFEDVIDRVTFANQLINSGKDYLVALNMNKFNSLPQEILDQLPTE